VFDLDPDNSSVRIDLAVSVKNVSKKYRIYDKPKNRLKEMLHPLGRKYHRDFWVLDDVSFDLQKGDTLGVIGRNGSGKSTLLQIICGILRPNLGSVTCNGRISALLELGAGFNPDFTGRRNVYMNGILMGFTKEEMDGKIDEIAAFADIGDFLDQPVKFYSSGMFVRLAFACAINVKPDILVVDEALSVGDIFFQQKSFKTMRRMIEDGTTCVLVSHDIESIIHLCNKSLILDGGRVEFAGDPADAKMHYLYFPRLSELPVNKALSSDTDVSLQGGASDSDETDLILKNNIMPSDFNRAGDGNMIIEAVRVTDEHGADTLEVFVLKCLNFHVLVRVFDIVRNPAIGIFVLDKFGNTIFIGTTRHIHYKIPSLKPPERIIVVFEIVFNIRPGSYTFCFSAGDIIESHEKAKVQDIAPLLGPLTVKAKKGEEPPFGGLTLMPFSISCNKLGDKRLTENK
jgi:ABC-type polysaccharide/polyol phosphate transport system ATPase subunit